MIIISLKPAAAAKINQAAAEFFSEYYVLQRFDYRTTGWQRQSKQPDRKTVLEYNDLYTR
jgi:hypothetical protein